MLPVSYNESQEELAQRQANFILLRSLEHKIPSALFNQVFSKVSPDDGFPKRMSWKGESYPRTYQEMKTNFCQVDQNYLPELLISVENQKNIKKGSKINSVALKQKSKIQSRLANGSHQSAFSLIKAKKNGNFNHQLNLNIQNQEVAKFERLKTVFGHAALDNGDMTPIYNIQFSKDGKFIITGADDGLIKIWDKETLTLQVSLHGHSDYIIDLDVSKCNKFIASADREGLIIIWNLQQGKIQEKIVEHSQPVNNLRFYSHKLKQSQESTQKDKKDYLQILVSCSDDGTVKLFDFSQDLQDVLSQSFKKESQEEARKTRRQEQVQKSSRNERFFISLSPEDVRPGSRAKKIESVNLNQNGVIAAGTSYGEIYSWKIDFQAFHKHSQKCYTYLGCFKKHQRSIHFCEFSENGKMLLTGSTDGTAKVWTIEIEKFKKGDSASKADIEKQKKIELFNSKQQVESKPELKIESKIFTENNKQYYFLFQKTTEFSMQLKNQKSSQVDCANWSAHGRYAIVALSGKPDEFNQNAKALCQIKVWDSFTGEMINDLVEKNGVQITQYSFVLTSHPYYEDILLTGSEGGLVYLWNLKTRKLIKKFVEYGIYSIEKFTFNDPFDGKFSPDGHSFVIGSQDGTISLFSNNCSSEQYSGTRVEQFFEFDGGRREENFFHNLEQEPKICSSNLTPYEYQPPNMILGKFQNDKVLSNEEYERTLIMRQALCVEEEEFLENQLEEGRRNNFFNNDEDQDMLDIDQYDMQEQAVRRNRINSNIDQENNQSYRTQRGTLVIQDRVRTNIDPNNSLYDRESDTNFNMDEQSEDNESSSSSYGKEDAEEAYQSKNEFKVTRENYFSKEDKEQDEENDIKPSTRQQRHLRRLKRIEESEDNGFEVEEQKQALNGRPQRRQTQNRKNYQETDDYIMSEEEKVDRKRLVRNKAFNKDQYMDSESEAESFESDDDDEMYSNYSPQKKKQSKPNYAPKINKFKPSNSKSHQFGYQSQDEMELSQKEQIKSNKRRKVVKDDSNSDENLIQQNNIKSKGGKIEKPDEDYELLVVKQENLMTDIQNKCALCQRIDNPIIGPFINLSDKSKNTEQLYFHKECLEINMKSSLSAISKKFVGIRQALEANEYYKKKRIICHRCFGEGPSIKCQSCEKYYHGFVCSTIYLIWMGGNTYQCFDCRNTENHENLRQKLALTGHEYQEMCRKIPREHLLENKPNNKQYIPQMHDEVYYFFQGHEKFISMYNCFFYSGNKANISFEQPWRKHKELKFPTLCKIINIFYQFPSKNSIYLLKRFGKINGQDLVQTPQIVQELELQIMGDYNKRFKLQFFPNDMSDFLVLKEYYETAYQKFYELQNQNKMINQTFETVCKNFVKVKVVQIQPREPTLYPNSQWEGIQFYHQEAYRFRRRGQRRGEEENANEPPSVINFWELKLENTVSQSQIKIFDEDEKQRLINCIDDIIAKKHEMLEPFLTRVTDKIAPDYKCHVQSEMYVNLIKERINNDYYRSQIQLLCDLDLISNNCKLYNGPDDLLTKDAERCMEKLRIELKQRMNSNKSDSIINKQNHGQIIQQIQKESGKLTAPPIFVKGQSSSMDYFLKQQQEDVSQQQNNIGRQRTLVEESKQKENINPLKLKEDIQEDLQINGFEESDKNLSENESPLTIKMTQSKKAKKRNLRRNDSENIYSDAPQIEQTQIGKRTRQAKDDTIEDIIRNGDSKEDDQINKRLTRFQKRLKQ